MNKQQSLYLILLLVLALGILSAGGVFGILYQKQKDRPQIKKMETSLKILGSEVVPSIISYGRVTNITGRQITLAFNSDLITVNIRDDAPVYTFTSTGSSNMTQSEVSLNQIKAGDTLNISINVGSDGTFEGNSVIVLPKNN